MFSSIASLEDANLVIVGYGSIGQEVARKAKAFDMNVAIVSRDGKTGPNVDRVYPRSELRSALAEANAIVLCLPSAPETRGIIGAGEFAAMKKAPYLINIARGDLLDDVAFVDALRSRVLSGAAIDVAQIEPLPEDHVFWSLDNLLITPHAAGAGSSGYARFNRLFSENLRRLKAGEPLLQQLN
jgi:phosphoglycerate dehydrogenase-like enzyme